MNQEFVAGADIGGTHIAVALVNVTNGNILHQSMVRRTITPQMDAAAVIETWASAIESAFLHLPGDCTRKAGIAMPGPMNYDTGLCLIKNQDKYESLYGLNIKELLGARLGLPVTSIRMMNDARCFLQGEWHGGAARGHQSALFCYPIQ